MSHQHDVDSLEALQATLAWYRMKQRVKRWARAVPVVAFLVGLALVDASHQTKASHPIVIGPWMLKVNGT